MHNFKLKYQLIFGGQALSPDTKIYFLCSIYTQTA